MSERNDAHYSQPRGPNRLYFNPDEVSITRGFLAHFDDFFSAHLYRYTFEDGEWEQTDDLEVAVSTIEEREAAILRWREDYGMTGNLLLDPDEASVVYDADLTLRRHYHAAQITTGGCIYYNFLFDEKVEAAWELAVGISQNPFRVSVHSRIDVGDDIAKYSAAIDR